MNTASKTAVVAVMTLALGRRDECSDGAPKFHSVSSSVDNSDGLIANWDEPGLGNENIHYTSTADASAFVCVYQ